MLFPFLTITGKATMKAAMNISFSVNISFHFSGINPHGCNAGLYGSGMLVLWETAKPFSWEAVPFDIPSGIVWEIQGFPQSHQPTFGVVVIFYFSHPEICIVKCHCGFNFHFPKANDVSTFSCAYLGCPLCSFFPFLIRWFPQWSRSWEFSIYSAYLWFASVQSSV